MLSVAADAKSVAAAAPAADAKSATAADTAAGAAATASAKAAPKWNVDASVLESAARAIFDADAVLFMSGAGLGVDGGLPDFRGPEGFWRAYPPMAKLKLQFHEMSTPSWFDKDPSFAWGFWAHRFGLYHSSQPHAGYGIMKQIAASKKAAFCFTSNVDCHWAKSGFGDTKIMECHGSTGYMQCVKPCTNKIWSSEGMKLPAVDEATFKAKLDELPRCPHCKGLARPNVMMFNDGSFIEDRIEGQNEQFQDFLHLVSKSKYKLAIIEIGAGEAVATVRDTSERASRFPNATLIRINPRDPNIPKRVPTGFSVPAGGLWSLEQFMVHINGWTAAVANAKAAIAADATPATATASATAAAAPIASASASAATAASSAAPK